MKLLNIVPFAALSAAFVVPDQEVMSQIAVESQPRPHKSIQAGLYDSISNAVESSKNALDEAIEYATSSANGAVKSFADAWDEARLQNEDLFVGYDLDAEFEEAAGHHKKAKKTIYELISSSKYTKKFTEFVDEYDDLVELLNSTSTNTTLFVPIDKAFEHVPKDPKVSKEFIKKVIEYHLSPEFFPASKVLAVQTIPTRLEEEALGGLQRISTQIGLHGLVLNWYSKVISINHFATNGVIHAVEKILVPPPNFADVIALFPGEFSQLELGLTKTSLLQSINDTNSHTGGTIFAPSNKAFEKLGTKANAFLFSRFGEKFLKALLKYHIVPDETLYSDEYYHGDSQMESIPKGRFHVDLPTLLGDRSLSIDVARFGRLIDMKINGYTRIKPTDGIVRDGVVQVVDTVLIPPKKVGGKMVAWEGEELTEDDLIEILEEFVEED